MEMSAREIKDRYERKGVSVSILADLNACSAADIKEILKSEGVKMPEPKKKETPEGKIKQHIETPEQAKPAAAVPELPQAVQQTIFDKLDTLENKMRYHEEQLKGYEAEYLELVQALGINKGRERA